ncbi:biotin/lipoyl-containing protein [Pseudobacteroides cellulosolvens]|uniref:Biotin/lipoyl attachment domain-containing protein n=1 Tax=Pseudobacteroides cellulosolvens ATCC 35603 = DSM 2933 TaxID=398512 RepID=A0A0L6JHG6_9FIRM|nr:biotin/lipoyl-containing protein [Pseudobacteroides cellulosolvens]KNY25155.1 biotin/lipoyl attachment domain-containing protein [Pseudobacteroides cellulosolvens ATCC 35603 = DSM 2933]
MKYIVTINGKNYEVKVEKGQATIVKTTETAEKAYVSQTVSASAQPAVSSQPAAATSVVSGDGEPIKSPMPGVILDVRVSAGATVKKGDILFILEAMKMENEIAAPENGVITAVSIAKGTSVSTGDVLALLKT